MVRLPAPCSWLAALLVFVGMSARPALADDWPQFRGPGARGVGPDDAGLPERWSATENVAWKVDLPGSGWSSPIVTGGRVLVTAAVSQGETEAPQMGLYFGGERFEPPAATHLWQVWCLDLESGATLWMRTVHRARPATGLHIKNSYASETPVTDGERVYAYFGNVGVFCFDLDGQLLWQRPLEPHRTRYSWGTAASPVLHGERLYIVNDNEEDSYLLALDRRTGEEIWRTRREEKSNWATPYVWEHAQRTEIVTPGTGHVRSYDLDGQLLWQLEGMSGITIATPYEAHGLLYVTSGYVMDLVRPIYAIRPGATGDITLGNAARSSEQIAWANWTAAPYNPSTIVYGDRLYVLYDRGLWACFDARTGEEIYSRQRLPGGRGFTSSPWAYDGKLFATNEDGLTVVIRAGDEFEVLHTNPLAEDDVCLATAAIAGDRLLIRTAPRLYCLQNTVEAGAAGP